MPLPPLLDTPRRQTPPPPPEATAVPRPDCGQCGCRIPLSAVRTETRSRGGTWFHFIVQHCDHCHVDFHAVFRRDAGSWTFVKVRRVDVAERMQRPGRHGRGGRKRGAA